MLIKHIILFIPLHENCGCYGNGNSHIAAKTYGSRDNSITIQASYMKLYCRTDGNVPIIHIILLLPSHENYSYYTNGNSQIVAKTYQGTKIPLVGS